MNLIMRLILGKTNQEKNKNVLSTITLGTYMAQTNQLGTLSKILWRNSISLTNKRYNLAINDLVTLKYYLHLYCSAIDRMNTEVDLCNLIAIAIEKQGENRSTNIKAKLQTDYFDPVQELHKVYVEINTTENVEESIESTLRRGKAWMLLGYIQLLLFGNLDLIDPIQKMELKLKYLKEDITDCKRTTYVAALQNRILSISTENKHNHPRLAAMEDCEKRLLKTQDDLKCVEAYRPPSAKFTSLSKDCASFKYSVGSYELVEKHMSNLSAIASKINEDFESVDLTIAESTLREAETWSLSIQRFAEQIETKYLSAYPDIILPLVTALTQLRHGVCIIINQIQQLVSLRKSEMANLESVIYNLIRFPTIGPQQENLLNLSDVCASRSTKILISKSLCSADEFVKMQEQFRIFKSSLQELHNHVTLNRCLTKSLWQDMNSLLQQIVLIWKQQQKEEEVRIAERDSLYKNKTENRAPTEEEELIQEVRELFPTHRETDFHDIEVSLEPSLEQQKVLPKKSSDSFHGLITRDDIKEIQKIHSHIVTSFITSKWMCNSPSSMTSVNYIGPLIQRYNTVHSMLDAILPSLSEKLAIKLHNSLYLLIALGLQASDEKNTNQTVYESVHRERTKAYDFYKDSNVEEVKQCIEVCDSILNFVDELLNEWPDHPVLRSIRCIIERIYTFPITSAVSRFQTGLELLLVKMHQWEETACSTVSMMECNSKLTRQIISWRKLELSCWKGCLDATFDSLRSDTSKWWFFLYALIENYSTRSEKDNIEKTENNGPITKQKLIETLERFMNESSLVEFEPRLNLLLTFHCHVYYFDDSDDKNEISAILWNVYYYYKQFLVDVNTKIAAIKTPIEKKLKNFVKIARWDDINYWVVKETVEKTHRTLHKFVKEYKNALKQNVSSCLIVKSEPYNTEINKGIWDDQNQRKNYINSTDFTVTKPSRFIDMKVLFTTGLIVKAETLLVKAKHLCNEIVSTSSYPCIRTDIDNFVQDFLEQSARLRDMEIDRSLPKDKQKSRAKSILQQKKMTLANYFKALTQLGVSYRIGELTLKNSEDKVMDFTMVPLDLSVIERCCTLKNIDQHMLIQWQGCEKYYYKSLARLNTLNTMFNTSQNDLGLPNIERCRGYSAHIMLMAHKQKTTIARSFDRFLSLRVQVSNLSEAHENDFSMLKQRHGRDCAESLKTLLITLETGFDQLLLFLQSCPQEKMSSNAHCTTLTLDTHEFPIINFSRYTPSWEQTNTLLKDSLTSIEATAKRFHALFVPFEILSANNAKRFAHTSFLSSEHFEFLTQSCAMIRDLRVRIDKLKPLLGNSDVAHPIMESVMFLDAKMEHFLSNFENLSTSGVELENGDRSGERLEESNNAVEHYELALEQLVNTILLVIQKKYKGRINLNDDINNKSKQKNDKNDAEDETDAKEEVEENALKEMLIDSLEKDLVELKLSKITELYIDLLQSIHEVDLESANYCTR